MCVCVCVHQKRPDKIFRMVSFIISHAGHFGLGGGRGGGGPPTVHGHSHTSPGGGLAITMVLGHLWFIRSATPGRGGTFVAQMGNNYHRGKFLRGFFLGWPKLRGEKCGIAP